MIKKKIKKSHKKRKNMISIRTKGKETNMIISTIKKSMSFIKIVMIKTFLRMKDIVIKNTIIIPLIIAKLKIGNFLLMLNKNTKKIIQII